MRSQSLILVSSIILCFFVSGSAFKTTNADGKRMHRKALATGSVNENLKTLLNRMIDGRSVEETTSSPLSSLSSFLCCLLGSTTGSAPPSALDSGVPSVSPTMMRSELPSPSPSISQMPTLTGSDEPSLIPSLTPTLFPSLTPSQLPSLTPSQLPSGVPSQNPSFIPSSIPSTQPSGVPSVIPSTNPSFVNYGVAHEIKLSSDDTQCLYMEFDGSLFDEDPRAVGTRTCSGVVWEEWQYIGGQYNMHLLFVDNNGGFFQISRLNYVMVEARSTSDMLEMMKIYLGTSNYADYTIKGRDANDDEICMAHQAGNTGHLKWVDCSDPGALIFTANKK